MKKYLLLVVVMLNSLSSLSWAAPVQSVKNFELSRYLGTWYEIASFPQRFQKNCVCTKATYSLKTNGDVKVYNSCRKKSPQGPLSDITGTAKVPNPKEPAQLKVKFFPLAPGGDYWVLDINSDYSVALVGAPDRDYLWILAKNPFISQNEYFEMVRQASLQGFDVSRLAVTQQEGCPR